MDRAQRQLEATGGGDGHEASESSMSCHSACDPVSRALRQGRPGVGGGDCSTRLIACRKRFQERRTFVEDREDNCA